jgi:hypothetical protein
VAALAIACSSQSSYSGLNSPLNVRDADSFVADTGSGPIAIMEPDMQYHQKLDDFSIQTRGWRTDFSRHTVAFGDIFSGGVGRDGIPPLDRPQ